MCALSGDDFGGRVFGDGVFAGARVVPTGAKVVGDDACVVGVGEDVFEGGGIPAGFACGGGEVLLGEVAGDLRGGCA